MKIIFAKAASHDLISYIFNFYLIITIYSAQLEVYCEVVYTYTCIRSLINFKFNTLCIYFY